MQVGRLGTLVLAAALPVFASGPVQAQASRSIACEPGGKCCQPAPEIPPLDQLGCAATKAHLYAKMPQVLTHQGWAFEGVRDCSRNPAHSDSANLGFGYCLPETRLKMRINIRDLNAGRYQDSKLGRTLRDMELMPLTQPQGVVGLGIMPSTIRRFDTNLLHAARLTPHADSPSVGFIGYHQDGRYKITVDIDDPLHTIRNQEELEAFLAPLLSQFP